MRYRVKSPIIPDLVKYALSNTLPQGFYTNALPVTELTLILEDLPPNTDVIINGRQFRTDSMGKVEFQINDPSSVDYVIEAIYPSGGASDTLLLREYVNLTWITLQSFIEAYNILYIARRLLSISNTDILPFRGNEDISSAGTNLDSLFEGASDYWLSALGGLFSPDSYLGIDNVPLAETEVLPFLNYTPHVMMYYYLERLLGVVYGVGVAVSFLPVNLNLFRFGLEFFIKDLQLTGVNRKIVWNMQSTVQEFFFNNLTYSGSKTHALPEPPDEGGWYVLSFSPELHQFSNPEFTTSYSYQKLDSSITPFIGYHIEEAIVKAVWDEQRKAFVTLTPILSNGYGVLYEAGWSSFPIPLRRTPTEFVMPDGSNHGLDYIYIRGITPRPNIPILVIHVTDTGGIDEVYTSPRLLTEMESLSGVDVFVGVEAFDSSEDKYRAMVKTVWLALEKGTFPSLSSVGWIGAETGYMGGIIPAFMSVHKRN